MNQTETFRQYLIALVTYTCNMCIKFMKVFCLMCHMQLLLPRIVEEVQGVHGVLQLSNTF